MSRAPAPSPVMAGLVPATQEHEPAPTHPDPSAFTGPRDEPGGDGRGAARSDPHRRHDNPSGHGNRAKRRDGIDGVRATDVGPGYFVPASWDRYLVETWAERKARRAAERGSPR